MPELKSKESRLSKFITKRVEQLAPVKQQREIAEQAGYENHNVISMLKSGISKLPLDRVPAMAKALDVDPAFLFNLALEQYIHAPTLAAVRQIFGAVVSQNEADFLKVIRDASGDSDPALTPALEKQLADLIKKSV